MRQYVFLDRLIPLSSLQAFVQLSVRYSSESLQESFCEFLHRKMAMQSWKDEYSLPYERIVESRTHAKLRDDTISLPFMLFANG